MIRAEDIVLCARELGLDDIGFAPVRRLDREAAFMDAWVTDGYAGKMDYLARNTDRRYDPSVLVPDAKTIVVCVLTYDHCGRDYHRKMKSLLYMLEKKLLGRSSANEVFVADSQHVFCDSAPFLERRWAVEAGLGWIGRNHQFIHNTLGSQVHLAEWVLNEEPEGMPEPLTEEEISRRAMLGANCGDCCRCIVACPGGALTSPVWDPRLCIAYDTYHCMVCQNVCPYGKG